MFLRIAFRHTKGNEVSVRFRLRDGRDTQLFYVSDFEIHPTYWDTNTQKIKAKVLCDEAKRVKFNRQVSELKSIIAEYNLERVSRFQCLIQLFTWSEIN